WSSFTTAKSGSSPRAGCFSPSWSASRPSTSIRNSTRTSKWSTAWCWRRSAVMALHDRHSHNGRDTAIHQISAAGEELGFRRSQKRGYRRYVFRSSATAHRAAFDVPLDLFRVGLVPFARNIRCDVAGHYRVDRNSVRSQHRSHRLDKRVDPSLGGTVM